MHLRGEFYRPDRFSKSTQWFISYNKIVHGNQSSSEEFLYIWWKNCFGKIWCYLYKNITWVYGQIILKVSWGRSVPKRCDFIHFTVLRWDKNNVSLSQLRLHKAGFKLKIIKGSTVHLHSQNQCYVPLKLLLSLCGFEAIYVSNIEVVLLRHQTNG